MQCGDQTDNSALSTGAVYVFIRDAQDEWSQQAYVKASNTNEDGSDNTAQQAGAVYLH